MLQMTGGAVVAGGALAATTPLTGLSAAHADTFVPTPLAATDPEPNIERSKHWWPAQRNVWTPIGWKGHLFRFNVVYNGALICDPSWVMAAKPNTQPWHGKNFQTTVVMPMRGGGFRPFPTFQYEVWDDDLGQGKQGWEEDSDTPVLWTEHRRQEGLVIKQSIFAHVPGEQAVQTATEPMYSWTRFEVTHVDPVNAVKDFVFQLWLSGSYMKPAGPYQDEDGVPLTVFPETAPILAGLTMGRVWNPTGKPITVPITDNEGNVKVMVTTADKGSIAMTENKVKGVYDLRLGLPATVGAYIDVLIPMIPAPLADAKAEAALGRDAALAKCQAFWKENAASIAVVDTPENYINQVMRRGPQLAQVVAEKSPDTGLFTFLSGSYAYDVLWSTPTSMVSHMFMDRLGYHDVVENHIEIYAATQGTRTPPGAVFAGGTYPGYLSTPKTLQAVDWISDHGAILEILSVHALLTNRPAFIAKWTDVIVKACDYIVQACGLTNHSGVQGLMPPGHSTDEGVETQGFISQCFTYKGLASAVEFLQRIKHPRAAEFATFANTFRTTFVQAVRDLADRSVKWTDAKGKQWPVFRPQFAGEGVWDAFTMLDTGALMSVWAGLMPASDPMMKSFVEFFRVGPNTLVFDAVHHNALDRAVLDHEQSSAEPCYSWNMFHTWQLGERAPFIEGLYGLLTGGLSQDTYISSEHRNAIYGNLFSHPIITWSLLHAVIDDSLVPNQLQLLRLCPLEWLSGKKQTRFEKVPTKFGPVTLRFKLEGGRGRDRDDDRHVDDDRSGHDTLKVEFSGDWHHKPGRVIVETPPLPGLKWIVVNGNRYRAGRRIEL